VIKLSTLLSPLQNAQQLLDKYRHYLRTTLQQWLNEKDTDTIIENLAIDSGIYLSRNPQYKRYDKSFRQFCMDEQLVEILADNLFVDGGNPYIHQIEAIRNLNAGKHTIIATGTGSGKTESFLVPILNHCLMDSTPGVKAILVYPMNALASDQIKRLEKYTQNTTITFGIYTGSTPENERARQLTSKTPNQILYRDDMIARPPDILITNYVMLDWMLTKSNSRSIFTLSAQTMRFIVLDEIHTYSGTKAAHIKYLLGRLCHHFTKRIVFTGTSATLMSKESAHERLRAFVTTLFPMKPEEYTPPITATEHLETIVPNPMPIWDKSNLDYSTIESIEAAAHHLSGLLGVPSEGLQKDFSEETIHESPFYRALREDSFIDAIYHKLREGSVSLTELVTRFDEYLFVKLSYDQRIYLVKLYLDAVAFLNAKAEGKGRLLLDYRIHVFLSDVGDNLKRCLNCGRFHVGLKDHCTDCRGDLFCVYKKDIRWSIAKITGQQYSPFLGAEPEDLKNSYYVLIAVVDQLLPVGTQGFRVQLESDRTVNADSNGKYWLHPLDASNIEQVEQHLICLRESTRDYQYLQHLLTNILDSYPRDFRKSLAFTDSRGSASRYSSILRDEYASRFLEAFVHSEYPNARDANILKTLEFLEYRVDQLELTDVDRSVFDELRSWYYRALSIPERMGGIRDLLRIDGNFSGLEEEILDIFLRERAIDKSWFVPNPKPSGVKRFIYFQQYWTHLHHGIFFAGQASQSKQYSGVALSEQSVVYQSLKGRIPEIGIAVESLVDKDIILEKRTEDDKIHYYLNPDYVCFADDESPQYSVDDYEKLRNDLLYIVQAHSSEISADVRGRIEEQFTRGTINLVIATPTLEMGIDIGELQNVVMIGVPPSPANYAQRAGRAGRRKGRNALIATFCYADRPHDMAAFSDPKSMINGQISPPQFNPKNAEVLKKHINAYLLRDHLKSLQSLRTFHANLHNEYYTQIPALHSIFGDWFDYETYLDKGFAGVVDEILVTWTKDIRKYCYGKGIFPDYEFPHDEVLAIEQKVFEDPTFSPIEWNDKAITRRQPEQALTYLAPGEVIYAAGDIYRVINEGKYQKLDDGARQYSVILVEKETLFASRHKERSGYDIRRKFEPPTIWSEKGGILAISYVPECVLAVRNYGPQTAKQKNDNAWTTGFDFTREAFILRFDTAVCHDELINSFIAALDRTLNERFSLNAGEIRLMPDVQTLEPDGSFTYITFYDAAGNQNLPLDRIEDEFDQIVREIFERLAQCSCEDGCYNCIKSYNLQFLDSAISKKSALMFTSYLLGQSPFIPTIARYKVKQKSADLQLCVEMSGAMIIISMPQNLSQSFPIKGDQNSALYSGLTEVIDRLYQPGMQSLHIFSPMSYVVDAINKRQNQSGKDAFRRFQFTLLKFPAVQASVGKCESL